MFPIVRLLVACAPTPPAPSPDLFRVAVSGVSGGSLPGVWGDAATSTAYLTGGFVDVERGGRPVSERPCARGDARAASTAPVATTAARWPAWDSIVGERGRAGQAVGRQRPVCAKRSVNARLNFATKPWPSGGTSKHASKVRGSPGFRVSPMPSVFTAMAHAGDGS